MKHGFLHSLEPFFEVPCGWCLNCRVDRRNFYEDCANANYKKFGHGCFCTFTYADTSLHDNLRYDSDGNVTLSLVKKHYQNFLMRLRSYLKYHDKYVKNVLDRDFKYTFVGEYGEDKGRPHFHALFFGIDYSIADKLFNDIWGLGDVQVGPILDGGVRYVLKYMDKEIRGKKAKELYDDQGIQRPFMQCSKGFGNELYFSQKDYILSHNFCYKAIHNLDRPISPYWRRKLRATVSMDNENVKSLMRAHCVKPQTESTDGKRYSLKEINAFKKQRANIRERKLEIQARSDGTAVDSCYHMEYIKMIN